MPDYYYRLMTSSTTTDCSGGWIGYSPTASTTTTTINFGVMTQLPLQQPRQHGWLLARCRAERLLRRHLDESQRRELRREAYFVVISADGERRYRIYRGLSGVRNIERTDADNRRLATLCAHPACSMPDADILLAQKLMLEDPVAEREFLALANVS